MKPRKTITDAVLAANRNNARSSLGPTSQQGKSNSCQNAVRHGLLSKTIALETDDERAEFEELVRSLNAEFSPDGVLEEILVEEIATSLWKLRLAVGFESRELSSRKNLRDRLTGVFDCEIELPLAAEDLPLDRGWDCERLVVRAVAARDGGNSGASRGPTVIQGQRVPDSQSSQRQYGQAASHLEIEAVLGNSLINLTRYQATLKRDFYRAVETLRAVQAERREAEGGK